MENIFTYYKEILWSIAIILWFIAYIPYIQDMIINKTKPHVFSRFIWGINAIIIFFAVQRDNAGPGAWATLFAGLICMYITGYAFSHQWDKQIKKVDIIFLILAVIALALRSLTKTPLWSLILIIGADIFAFIPTIRKSWNDPHTETISTYLLNAVKYIIMLIALTNYSFITMLDITIWLILSIVFIIFLYFRRHQLTKE